LVERADHDHPSGGPVHDLAKARASGLGRRRAARGGLGDPPKGGGFQESGDLPQGRDGPWEIVESRDFSATELRDVERTYATEFAAEMLMPRVALAELSGRATAVSLAATFAVTGDIMKFRLDQIGWRR
jgi:hypothetical protein